ncbi:MAG: AmmeMemoRadiSam system protein A [Thermoanaerobaculia bacterium]
MSEPPAPLSEEARRDLLRLARGSLEARFRGEPPPRLASDRAEAFGSARGLFVTLKRDGQLRGCIGTLSPEGDLTRVVAEFARRAAFEDPRFPPLEPSELPGCEIEISVLTAPQLLEDPGEIAIGRDGLIVEGRGRRGLLLPQVATEWGFAAARFLQETCRKAGLPAEAWRDPEVRVWKFQAEVFGESQRREA